MAMSSGKPPFSFGLTVAAQRAIADAKSAEETRIRLAEHRMEQEARLAEFRRKREEANAALPAALAALDAITEQPSRLILDLHQRVKPAYGSLWRCEGCDAEGYDWEYPEWPCSTTEAIAEHHGITLPNSGQIDRPKDGSLDAPVV